MERSPSTKAKKSRLALLLAIAVAPGMGCASMKSPTQWFSKTDTAASSSSSWSQSLSSTGKGITGQFKTMGSTMTSAVGKAKNAVVNTFSSKDGQQDGETSLAQMPDKNMLGPEIWVTNGQVYEMKGNYTAALDNYTKALEKEPNNVPALQSVARLHLRQEQFPQAVDAYQKVVRVAPTAENYSELASSQQKSGRLTDAQASIQKAISIDPSTQRYRNNLAGILVAGGQSDEAVRELTQVFPPAVANYNVAYLHFMNKNNAAAQQHLQAALQADPNLQPARDLMNTLSASQQGQTAMAAYNTANQVYKNFQNPAAQPAPTNNSMPVSGSTSPSNISAPSLQYSQLPQLPQVNR